MKLTDKIPTKNVELYHFPSEYCTPVDGEPEMICSDAQIEFNFDVEYRENGVKTIMVNTSKIAIEVGDSVIEIDPYYPATIGNKMNKYKVEVNQWEIIDDVDLSNRQCYVESIELDWRERRAYVYYK